MCGRIDRQIENTDRQADKTGITTTRTDSWTKRLTGRQEDKEDRQAVWRQTDEQTDRQEG
jgi:hypothetical protein